MEHEQSNIFPEIVLFDRLHKVAALIGERLSFCYFNIENSGAAEFLDSHLYDRNEL